MQEKNNCKNCEEKQACVPFFIHENALSHKDMDNERMARIVKGQRIANIVQSIIIMLIVFIFVWFYTSRAQIWSNTISDMKQAIVEVIHAKENTLP